jgi:hypothetical protein
MPTDVVRLDELVPEDIEFEHEGTTYSIPGDLGTEQRFRFGRLFRDLAIVEAESISAQLDLQAADTAAKVKRAKVVLDKAEAAHLKVSLAMEAALLETMQIRQPELKKLPMGTEGTQTVLLLVLARLGGAGEEENPPNRATRRAHARKK